MACGGHAGRQGFVLLLEGDGVVGAGGGDDCVLSKNKSGELRLNLSRS